MSHSHDDPPPNWCEWWADLTKVNDDIYYGWPRNISEELAEANPHFWHWCTSGGRWVGQGTSDHTLVSREPLHLEPSLLWNCCGLHGFLREGIWSPA